MIRRNEPYDERRWYCSENIKHNTATKSTEYDIYKVAHVQHIVLIAMFIIVVIILYADKIQVARK